MNEYKISYSSMEGNAQATVIEISESAARKAFKANHKGMEIADVELIRTGVPATKQQEREALEKIKAMVAELGPQSYLATAFEGCFTDAENNIENDFGDSMQRRWESAEEKLAVAQEEDNRLKTELNEAREQLVAAQKQISTLKRQQLPEQLRRDLWVMATDEAEASRSRMAKAAHMMAVCADNPACVGFQESVADYRKEEKRAEVMEQRAAALDALTPKSE